MSAPVDERSEQDRAGTTASWRQARRMLAAVDPLPPIAVPLQAAVGAVLVAPITTATDIPITDAAVEHGWAVAGQGPWTVIDDIPAKDLLRLPDRHAVPVTIGSPLPEGATAVVARTGGVVDAGRHGQRLQIADEHGDPAPHPGLIRYGRGIAPQGRDARAGQRLLSAGPVVTPATVALAAAVGRDDLTVIPPPTVSVILPQYGLARRGPLRPGRQRDSVAELLPTWVEAGPARLLPAVTVPVQAATIARAIEDTSADVVVVAGGLAPEVPAQVREAAGMLAADPVVGGLSVWPGGDTRVLALGADRFIVLLPGRPSAAAVGLAIVLDPLLAALSGRPSHADGVEALLASPVSFDGGTTVIPGILERSELALSVHPRRWSGPGGLQGLAAADGLIILEPGTHEGALVPLLPLPGVLVG
jgi:molybdopterin molybdotransferase